MQLDSDSITYLVGDLDVLRQISGTAALPIFSNDAIVFFDQLSKLIMHDEEAKKYPDVIAYAFWIRKGNILKAKEKYVNGTQWIGRGIAFQIAPSNIPVQFAVSLTYALLSGNASIIRISEKKFEQVDIICRCINTILETSCSDMRQYFVVMRYGHDDRITQQLSDICDVRMIWGGDASISAIRKLGVPARCIDLGFADRYSIAVIDSDELLKQSISIIANDFYNDTYFSDQNACSSPRLVVWTGTCVEKARDTFWKELERLVEEKYNMEPIFSSEKLLNTAVLSAVHSDLRQIKNNNLLVRLETDKLYEDLMEYKGNCGYFFEYVATDLEEIVPILKKECQTVIYLGNIEMQLRSIIDRYGVRGVDRIVPIGHGSDISFVWDGLELPYILGRQIGNT